MATTIRALEGPDEYCLNLLLSLQRSLGGKLIFIIGNLEVTFNKEIICSFSPFLSSLLNGLGCGSCLNEPVFISLPTEMSPATILFLQTVLEKGVIHQIGMNDIDDVKDIVDILGLFIDLVDVDLDHVDHDANAPHGGFTHIYEHITCNETKIESPNENVDTLVRNSDSNISTMNADLTERAEKKTSMVTTENDQIDNMLHEKTRNCVTREYQVRIERKSLGRLKADNKTSHMISKQTNLSGRLKNVRDSETTENESEMNQKEKHECGVCLKGFKLLKSFKRHCKIHERNKKFKCSFCSKGFDRRYVLNDHLKNHTGEKPFECTICEKRFTRSFVLLRHMRTHDAGVYKCKFCTKTFVRQESFTGHVRNHAGVKPFNYKLCGKAFSRSSVISHHEKLNQCEKISTVK